VSVYARKCPGLHDRERARFGHKVRFRGGD
jgi:hypothetical protein